MFLKTVLALTMAKSPFKSQNKNQSQCSQKDLKKFLRFHFEFHIVIAPYLAVHTKVTIFDFVCADSPSVEIRLIRRARISLAQNCQ